MACLESDEHVLTWFIKKVLRPVGLRSSDTKQKIGRTAKLPFSQLAPVIRDTQHTTQRVILVNKVMFQCSSCMHDTKP